MSATAVSSRSRISKVGAWLSIACAIQCLASPLLLAVLPFLKTSPVVEHTIVVLSLIIGIGTGTNGYLEHRRVSVIFWIAAASICLIVGNWFAEHTLELILKIGGALIMAGGQFLNIHYEKEFCRRRELSSIATRA
jgi:uncharacterized membrane protein YfcA